MTKNTVYPMIFITFFGFVKQIISVYHFSAKFCKISMFGIKKTLRKFILKYFANRKIIPNFDTL